MTYPEPETNTTNNVASWLINVCNDTAPIVDFTYLPEVPIGNEPVIFNASYPFSYDQDWGNITTYSWNFNGTTVPPEADPITNCTFVKHGSVNVSLTLYDTEGKNCSKSKLLRVYARPVANFHVSGEFYAGYPLTFNASSPWSYDLDGSIINYKWDFGDNNITEGLYPVIIHVYATNKNYTAKLTVTDNDTLTSSAWTQLIRIGSDTPTADFTIISPLPGPYYVNEILTFDASNSTADGGTIKSYFWNWDDGTNRTEIPVINHTFTQPKTYNVTLIVTDSDDKTSLPTSKNITVSLPVLLKVMPENVTADPPDGPFKINITIANVEDLKSFTFTLSWPKDWLPPTYDLLDYKEAEAGDFLGPEKYPNGTRRWNFIPAADDGEGHVNVTGTFTDFVPVGERNGIGTLATITFKVKASGNATLDLKDTILRYSNGSMIGHSIKNDGYFYTSKPVANFTYSPEFPSVNDTITFDASASYDPDNSTALNNGIVNYSWNFGDGNITTISNQIINYTYSVENVYTVILNVTDADGKTWNFTCLVTAGYVHDVAIIDVEPYPFAFNETSGVYETAGVLQINVTVMNYGTVPEETFNVTVYAENATHTIEIGTQTVSLLNGTSKNLTFYLYAYLWNATHGLAKGNYTISANASLVDDTDLANNYRTDGTVTVYLSGDVNRDGIVEMMDFYDASLAFGSTPTSPNWDRNADVCADGIVEMMDFFVLAQHFGEHYP
jgi:PKD repeat protein